MKKIFISSVVILSFLAYSFYQRVLSNESAHTISYVKQAPSSGSVQNTPTPQATPTPTISPSNISTAPKDTPTQTPTPTPKPSSLYKDGSYTGIAADAFYGNIQVQAVIANGRITDVKFLQYPNDRDRSIEINSYADPILAQEAIQAQTANVDVVSGATDSSQAFIQSLQSALDQAKS